MARRRLRWRRPGLRYSPALSALMGIGLAILFIGVLNTRMRPMMTALASAQVNNEVVRLLGQAAEELALSYDDVVELEKDGEGKIIALKSDMSAVSAYRTRLLEYLVEHEGDLKQRQMRIPLGALTGVEFLSALGPGIPVRILSIDAPSSRFENEFSSAGINQTRHQIMLHVTVSASFLLPGETAETEVTTQICVAETIIVGSVPEHYTYFSQFDTAKEAADAYFDYGEQQ